MNPSENLTLSGELWQEHNPKEPNDPGLNDPLTTLQDLTFYHRYTEQQLINMGNLYYTGKCTRHQKIKYENIRAGLLLELRSLYPEAKDTGTALYIHNAIGACLHKRQQDEQPLNDRVIANGHTAHQQLKNWK